LRPRVNLVLYYGVLGARAGWRSRIVGAALAQERPEDAGPARLSGSGHGARDANDGGVAHTALDDGVDRGCRCRAGRAAPASLGAASVR
jgi:hypothetical protein